ncbi:MAG: glycosyltransferase family 4 protein, partial [Bacteroidales bacterium]|nr:glycosyltransferase family 4 protein [Bacteroidales bacterium]
FFFKNILKFNLNYNGVIGLKSLLWFLTLDISKFNANSKIHAQFATQASIIALLIKKYYDNSPEYSFTFHAYDIYFNNKWFSLLVKNCYKAFSISQYNIGYVQEKYLKSAKITLSRLGVFRNQINKSEKKDSKYFTLGLMSWFVEKKGINYLLEAFLILKKQGYDDIELILAGDGPLKDEYLEFINTNSLSENINYIGKIKGKQKEDFFNSLDTFILPAISLPNDQDGIPVVIMEAIAYSLPIISTKVSGIPEICNNDYNGILVKERCINEIVDAIIFMYNKNNTRQQYSNNSYTMSEKYDVISNSNNKIETLDWYLH